MNQPSLYRQHSVEPNNAVSGGFDEDCVSINIQGELIGLNAYSCDKDYWIHNNSIKMYGLCEIST